MLKKVDPQGKGQSEERASFVRRKFPDGFFPLAKSAKTVFRFAPLAYPA